MSWRTTESITPSSTSGCSRFGIFMRLNIQHGQRWIRNHSSAGRRARREIGKDCRIESQLATPASSHDSGTVELVERRWIPAQLPNWAGMTELADGDVGSNDNGFPLSRE